MPNLRSRVCEFPACEKVAYFAKGDRRFCREHRQGARNIRLCCGTEADGKNCERVGSFYRYAVVDCRIVKRVFCAKHCNKSEDESKRNICRMCSVTCSYGWPFCGVAVCATHRDPQQGQAKMINHPKLQPLCKVCGAFATHSNAKITEFYCSEHIDRGDLDHRIACARCQVKFTPNLLRIVLDNEETRLVCYVCAAAMSPGSLVVDRLELDAVGRIAYQQLARLWEADNLPGQLTGRKRSREEI